VQVSCLLSRKRRGDLQLLEGLNDWTRAASALRLERFQFLLNRQNRSISLFWTHFRTQNRFTLLLEIL
jgi:hypothetical protein